MRVDPSTMPPLVLAIIALALVAQLAFGLVQAIGDEGDYAALVPRAGWTVGGEFVPLELALTGTEVPNAIVSDPDWVMWRSWTPAKGSTKGTIASAPFQTPTYIAVPYQGFPGESAGNFVRIECQETHRQVDVATLRTNTQWATVHLRLGAAFCVGKSRLIAASDGTNYVAVGTPFRVDSDLHHAQTNVAPRVLVALLSIALVVCHLLVGHFVAARCFGARDPFVPGFALFGVFGMAEIVLFVAWPDAAPAVSAALCGAVVAAAALLAVKRPEDTKRWFSALATPLLLWCLVCVFYVALAAAADSGGGSWAINGLFSPLRWSTDNQLPMLVAEGFYDAVPPAQIMIPPWHGFDRPPLLSGLLLPFRATLLGPAGVLFGPVFVPTGYMIVCAVLLALWVPVLHQACGLLDVRRAGVFTVSLAAVSPFFLFNTLYAWPKVLGGVFALLAFCLLYRSRADGTRDRTGLILVGVFAACSYLSHASNAFVLLPIAVFFVPTILRHGVGPVLWMGAVCAVLVGGWAVFVSATQPYSNALLRFALANRFGFEDRTVSLETSMADAYRILGWKGWLHLKAMEFSRLFVFSPYSPEMAAYGPGLDGIGAARVADFVVLARSIGVASVVAVGVLLAPRRVAIRWFSGPLAAAVRPSIVLGAVAVVFSMLCLLPTTSMVTLPYGAVMLLFVGAAMALYQAGAKVRNGLLAQAVLYFLVVWVWNPIAISLRPQWAAMAVLVEAAVLFLLVARSARDPAGA